MERLDGVDAAFLALETDTMHMHVGAVMVFDPSSSDFGGDSATRYFDRLRAVVTERIHLVPPLRRRVVRVPFGIQRRARDNRIAGRAVREWMQDQVLRPTQMLDAHGSQRVRALNNDCRPGPCDIPCRCHSAHRTLQRCERNDITIE